MAIATDSTVVERGYRGSALHPTLEAALAEYVVSMPAWKRAIDLAGATLGLLFLAPLLVLIALAIVLESRGGPIFRQTRVGHGGRTFTCLKFRSMRRDAEQMLAQLGAGLQSPLSAMLGALSGPLMMFVGALESLKTQREGA